MNCLFIIRRIVCAYLAMLTSYLIASGEWQFANGPFYSDIRDLVIDPQHPDTLVVATAVGTGLYKSINGGESWITIRNDSSQTKFYALAMVLDDPNTIYAGGAPGIHKTVNQGLSWNKLDLNEGVWSLAIDPSNSDIVYAGTMFSGLFQSTDNGSTWVTINNGLPVDSIMGLWIKAIAVDPLNSEVVYAATSIHGLFKSDNGGSSWIYLGFDGFFINDIVIDSQNSDIIYVGTGLGLYKSLNGGLNWDRTFIQSIRSIAIDPNDPETVYCGTRTDGVFVSTNGGVEWMDISNGLSWLGAYIWAIAINPQNSDVVYIGTGIGVYKSIDESYNWALKNDGFIKQTFLVKTSEADSVVTIYAGWQGIFKSTDNGEQWDYTGLHSSTGLAVVKNNPDLLFSSIYGMDISSHLYRSQDGGINWEYTGLSDATAITALEIDLLDYDIIYVGVSGGIAKSYNGGSEWYLYAGPSSANCIIISPQNTHIIYSGNSSGIYKSNNQGITWDFLGLTDKTVLTIAIDPLDSNIVYAGVWEEGIFKSTDAGSTWFEVNQGLINLNVQSLIIHPNQTDRLYAGTSGRGVFESLNGGMSWSEMNEGLDNLNVGGLDFDPTDPSKIYAATGGGVYIYNETAHVQGDPSDAIPSSFTLFNNYPNPFNAQTTIRFRISYDSYVSLIIYDVLGKEVVQLVSEYLRKGEYEVSWNGKENIGKKANSGIYFCQLRVAGSGKTNKMILLR